MTDIPSARLSTETAPAWAAASCGSVSRRASLSTVRTTQHWGLPVCPPTAVAHRPPPPPDVQLYGRHSPPAPRPQTPPRSARSIRAFLSNLESRPLIYRPCWVGHERPVGLRDPRRLARRGTPEFDCEKPVWGIGRWQWPPPNQEDAGHGSGLQVSDEAPGVLHQHHAVVLNLRHDFEVMELVVPDERLEVSLVKDCDAQPIATGEERQILPLNEVGEDTVVGPQNVVPLRV